MGITGSDSSSTTTWISRPVLTTPGFRSGRFDSATSGPVVQANGEGLAGAEQRIAILDVNGTRVLVLGWTIGSRLDEVAETWQVMDSIDFQ